MASTALRRLGILGVVLVALGALSPAYADPKKPKKPHPKKSPPPAATVPCVGNPADVRRLDLVVSGQPAYGLYALPSSRPRGLVVFMHGYGHTVESWRAHLTNAARSGVVAVAMNYRGTVNLPPAPGSSLPSSRGWQVAEGAEDSISAARHFDGLCRGFPVIVAYGISMGANTAGLAVAAGVRRHDGRPLFDYWIDVEGAANVIETYLEARALAQTGNTYAANARDDIERQMGGPIESRREVYMSRTVVNRVGEIKASGIKGIVIVHGVMDGLVPYNQSRELWALLRQAGVKTDFFTVATRGATSEPGTTIDGYATGSVPGYVSPFAGHASEASSTHIINKTGFARLALLLNGTLPGCREWLVDGTVDPSSPHPLTTGPTC